MPKRGEDDALNETKRLMAALGRMPPKPHEDMKLRKVTKKQDKQTSSKDHGRGRRPGQ